MADVVNGGDLSPLTNATAEDRARANEFYRQLALLQQQYQQQLAAQNRLGQQYDQVISGRAPSVAGTQLQRGVSQIRDATSAEAAGASGNNAAMANYGAIQALATAQTKANADAAMLRAKEVADARAGKAGLLNQEQAATQGIFAPTIAGSTGLSGQATTAAGQTSNLDTQEAEARRNFWGNLISGGGNGVTKLATM